MNSRPASTPAKRRRANSRAVIHMRRSCTTFGSCSVAAPRPGAEWAHDITVVVALAQFGSLDRFDELGSLDRLGGLRGIRRFDRLLRLFRIRRLIDVGVRAELVPVEPLGDVWAVRRIGPVVALERWTV